MASKWEIIEEVEERPSSGRFELISEVPEETESYNPPQNATEQIAGGFGNVLDAMTFGFGDEMVGTGAGTLDYLKSNYWDDLFSDDGQEPLSFVNAVQGRTSQAKGLREDFVAENPAVGVLGTVAGAISNPLDLAKKIKAISTLGKIGVSTGTGALQGGLFGLGSGEGNAIDRLKSAGEGAGIGALFGAGGGAATKLIGNLSDDLSSLGQRFKLGAFGISAHDARKAAAHSPRSAPNPLVVAMDDIEKSGAFKSGYNPQAVLNAMDDQSAVFGKEVSNLIDQSPGVNLLPSFNKTQKHINALRGTARAKAQAVFDEEMQALVDTVDNGGTLGDWQEAKQSLQREVEPLYSKPGATGAEMSGAEVKLKMASDIKDFIETEVTNTIPESAGKVKELNRKIGQREMLAPIMERAKARDATASPMNKLLQLSRTSGGIGVPLLLSGGVGAVGSDGDPSTTLATALAGALLLSRKGQYNTGKMLSGLGGIANKGSQIPQISMKALMPFLADGEPEKFSPNTVTLPASEYEVTDELPIEGNEKYPFLPALKMAVTSQESATAEYPNGNPNALSEDGAIGLMQILPSTGKELYERYGLKEEFGEFSDDLLYNPKINDFLGTKYLEELLDKYNGDVPLALTAYHSGMGRVDKLLRATKGRSLKDIHSFLGPVGKKYAAQILQRMEA